jgi:hypothetical protein
MGSSESSNNAYKEGEDKDIDVLYDCDDYKKIIKMEVIGVPAVNSQLGSAFLNLAFQSYFGSAFMHEALLFTTSTGRYWICQTYPIQFKGFDNEDDAINEIKKKWAINKDAKFVERYELSLEKDICLTCIEHIVDSMPNYYELSSYNCQHFCAKIIEQIYSTKCPHLENIAKGYCYIVRARPQ